ncbi:MAG: response regulator [Mariprofundus sp.]|nr:response regulator [Mariprofundus sp.]
MNSTSAFENRRQVLVWVHVISAIALAVFVGIHWLVSCCWQLLSVEAMLTVVMMLQYWRIRQGASLAQAENILMASALVLFSGLVFFESIESTGIYWLAGLPFVVYFVQQVSRARYWVLVFVLELIIAAVLQYIGLFESPHSQTQLFQVIVVVLFFWVFAHIYQSQYEWRKGQLNDSYIALQQQQDRMQIILDHSPIGIWMVDTDRKIQFLNKAWSDLCGVSEQQAKLAGDYSDLLAEDVAERALASDQLCFQSDQAYYVRDAMLCADGIERIFDFIKVRLVRDDGQLSGLVGFAIDVTEKLATEEEQKSLEKQVQHSQRLESLGVMAGGIAHDFNNLLTVIQGNIDLAKLEDNLTESLQESLSCVHSATQAATDLCRQMLDYSGKGIMRPEALNIQALVEDMLPLLYASKSKNVTLSFHVDQQPACVLADRSQFRQVLLNLVINAAEAIGKDETGDIHVSIVHRQLDGRDAKRFLDTDLKPGHYAVLVVQDNGMGMDAAIIEHIFDPFFTTKFAGRGLGMSAILGILRAHDAGMEINSEPGKGTTMSVWFPAIDTIEQAQLVNCSDVKRVVSERVLVVDDEPNVLHVASRMLMRLGLTVVTAANGLEAVALFEKDSNFDWVLLDVTMPEMGGGECLEKLRQIRPDIYVAMSSGFDAKRAFTVENDCQPNDFLTKPFTLDRLRDVAAKASE